MAIRLSDAARRPLSMTPAFHLDPYLHSQLMAETTPIEVWETILKFAIAVPLFLDPDPITNYGVGSLPRWQFEAPYWESERNRNDFRRVCKSWDAFLRPYMHRYVRMSDIYQSRVPETAAPMAIRFNIEPDIGEENDPLGLFSRMSRLLRNLITPPGPYITTATVDGWKMEILEGNTVMDDKLYVSFVEKAPRLRALLDLNASFGHKRLAPYKAAGLRLLYADISWVRDLREPFILPHLTTLHLPRLAIDASLRNLQPPCLQHLSIEGFSAIGGGGIGGTGGGGPGVGRQVFNDKIMEILRGLGKNLVTFHYRGRITTDQVSMAKIWPLIPHVEHIQLPYWVGAALPTDHPARITTLSIESLVGFMREGAKKPRDALFNHIPDSTQFPGHRLIIRMDIPWFTALMVRPYLSPTTPRIGISAWLAEHYAAKGVRFTDSGGLTLNEYLVFLIRAFWKGDRLDPVTRISKRFVRVLTF